MSLFLNLFVFKTKLNLQLSIVSEQLNHESFSQPKKAFHLSIEMLCLSFNKVWSYTNTWAAVIASMWATHLYVWWKESINQFRILSKESNSQQKFYQNKRVKSDLLQLISNEFQPLDSI